MTDSHKTSAPTTAAVTFSTPMFSASVTSPAVRRAHSVAAISTRVLIAVLIAISLAACGGKSESAGEEEHAHAEGEAGHEDPGHTDPDAKAGGEAAEAGHGEGAGEAGHAEGEAGHEEGPPSTTIPAAIAQASGIKVAPAAAGAIVDEHEIQGLLTPVEGRVAQVMARFPGPIRSLRANIGDTVRAGQPLASIESNLSLTTYTVSSPISGVVLQRSASVGGVAGEGAPLYEIGDLSQLWVDLHVFGRDAQHLTVGSAVQVTRMSDGVSAETTLERILPGTATASQSTIARATVANDDGLWRPGSAVRARVTVGRKDAALVIPLTALQADADNADVVFVRDGDRYAQRVVKLGQRDAQRVEVLSGLKAGEQVVVAQSFLVKADIEKSSASHEH